MVLRLLTILAAAALALPAAASADPRASFFFSPQIPTSGQAGELHVHAPAIPRAARSRRRGTWMATARSTTPRVRPPARRTSCRASSTSGSGSRARAAPSAPGKRASASDRSTRCAECRTAQRLMSPDPLVRMTGDVLPPQHARRPAHRFARLPSARMSRRPAPAGAASASASSRFEADRRAVADQGDGTSAILEPGARPRDPRHQGEPDRQGASATASGAARSRRARSSSACGPATRRPRAARRIDRPQRAPLRRGVRGRRAPAPALRRAARRPHGPRRGGGGAPGAPALARARVRSLAHRPLRPRPGPAPADGRGVVAARDGRGAAPTCPRGAAPRRLLRRRAGLRGGHPRALGRGGLVALRAVDARRVRRGAGSRSAGSTSCAAPTGASA